MYNWSRFFQFKKEANKNSFIIEEVYADPLESTIVKGRTPVYVNHIENILLDYLAHQENYTKALTKRQWLRALNMCEELYLDENFPAKIHNAHLDITTNRANAFYLRNNGKLNTILMNSLRSLKGRRLIDYTTEIKIIQGKEAHIASEEETIDILCAERYIMHDVMGYESVREVYRAKAESDYYENVNEYISKELNIDWYYRQIKVVYDQGNILEALDKNFIKQEREKLNAKIVNYIKSSEYKVARYLCNKYAHGYEEWCKEYCDSSATLINELINTGQPIQPSLIYDVDNTIIENNHPDDPWFMREEIYVEPDCDEERENNNEVNEVNEDNEDNEDKYSDDEMLFDEAYRYDYDEAFNGVS